MPNLYSIFVKEQSGERILSNPECVSVFYHNIFDYPLSFADIIRWRPSSSFGINSPDKVVSKNGYFFLEGKEGIIYKRILRRRVSEKKMKIARRGAFVLGLIPSVKGVFVTGSLAMENADERGDIDLLIITRKGMLWQSRVFVYLLLKIFVIKVRAPGENEQKDKLCLNMWFDESDLYWGKNRNIYTAHEIAQVVPIMDKDNIYEKFLQKNKWILKFWPYSVRIGKKGREKGKKLVSTPFLPLVIIEKLAYWFQYNHMKSRITREAISPTRAIFHPYSWENVVLARFST